MVDDLPDNLVGSHVCDYSCLELLHEEFGTVFEDGGGDERRTNVGFYSGANFFFLHDVARNALDTKEGL